ncbi:MAG TPA: maleylpyruvate isomerase family mycothiol-dependent enzyme [Acidimicrobiales bacterium]|nr:maleylpyruvate isomerase family mycothiol-dependent enzyme [Acidimicrobiales bacterium]
METAPGPWIDALRSSHDALQALVEPLDVNELQRPSYASEWSIAQVLSHLGSQAEIFNLFLEAGLSGQEPPGRETFAPIWDAWNAKNPAAQAADALRVDETGVARFESLGAEAREELHLAMFGMELDTTGLARMRLGEHAIHTWDIAVALDPTATVAPGAVDLLIDALDGLAARSGRPEGRTGRVSVSTTDPERHFRLEFTDKVALVACEPDETAPHLRLPAEAFVRLVYGRLDPDHTSTVETRGVDLSELREIFPGL